MSEIEHALKFARSRLSTEFYNRRAWTIIIKALRHYGEHTDDNYSYDLEEAEDPLFILRGEGLIEREEMNKVNTINIILDLGSFFQKHFYTDEY